MEDIPRRIPAEPVRFLDRLRTHIRSNNLALATERTYVHWVVRFIRFHKNRHPETMGSSEVSEFLTHLAVQKHVSRNRGEL